MDDYDKNWINGLAWFYPKWISQVKAPKLQRWLAFEYLVLLRT